MFNKINETFKSFFEGIKLSDAIHAKFFRHGVLSLSVIICGIILHGIFINIAHGFTNDNSVLTAISDTSDCKNKRDSIYLSQLENYKIYPGSWDTINIKAKQAARLSDQLKTVNNRIDMHFTYAETFYRYYFSFTSIAILFGLIAGCVLFYILYKGIVNTSAYILNLFLTCFAIFIYTHNMIDVYKQKQNINNNLYFLKHYKALQNFMLSYKVTGEVIDSTFEKNAWSFGFDSTGIKNKFIEPNKFIGYIDQDLARNFEIKIDFDTIGMGSPSQTASQVQNMINHK